jgi:uncharacterized LabA/DUF88 family protein
MATQENETPASVGLPVEPDADRLISIWDELDEYSRPKLLRYAAKVKENQSKPPAEPPRETAELQDHVNVSLSTNFHRAMIFVDGENLSARYEDALKERNQKPSADAAYIPGVLVWRSAWKFTDGTPVIVRKYYYTSTRGDQSIISKAEMALKDAGIEAPRVFSRGKDGKSKRVDVSLSTDMLLHATRRHFDLGVLVTGDADFIPLVEAVQAEGIRVHVLALSNGLSPKLKIAADHFICLDPLLLGP